MLEHGSFGEWVRRRRKALDLTQVELAHRMGYTVSTVRKIETTERRPSVHIIRVLLHALEVPEHEQAALRAAARSAGEVAIGLQQVNAQTTQTHQLPRALTPLIGRADELRAIVNSLSHATVRLITLTGPGGVGKTRLALEVAHAIASGDRTCWFVNLAPIRDPDQVLHAIARTLKVDAAPGTSLAEQIYRRLANTRTLLLLDNAEQVLDCAPMLGELLVACPHCTLLVTSRAPLRLSGEHEFEVPPLGLPSGTARPTLALARSSPAVALFVARAQQRLHSFSLSAATAATVIAICRRLDGLPLAIELVAAQIKLLPLPALLERLSTQLPALTSDARDIPARQQTLRSTIAWSYDLLDADAQALFRRLSIFVDSWTITAAEQVCRTAEPPAQDFAACHAALIEQSLIQRIPTSDEPRLTMLESVRAYAHEQLIAHGEGQQIAQQHAEYYSTIAEEFSQHGFPENPMLPLLATERNNIWEALRYALREQDIERSQRIFRSVYIYFFYCGDLREVTRQISAGLAMLWSPQLINGAGWVAALRGDYLQADAWFAQILDSGALSVDHSSQTLALRGQAYVAMARQEHTLAAQILAESLQVSARNGDVDGVNYAHFDRAFVALASEDLDQAERMYEDLLPIVRSAHDQIGVLRTTLMLARIKLRRERYRESAALYHTAWKLWGHVQAHQFVLEGIEGTAAVAVSQGDYVTAALLCGAAEAARAASGEVRLPAHRLDHDRTLAVLRSLPESPEVSQAWAEGRAITFAQAVTEAIAYTADASSAQ